MLFSILKWNPLQYLGKPSYLSPKIIMMTMGWWGILKSPAWMSGGSEFQWGIPHRRHLPNNIKMSSSTRSSHWKKLDIFSITQSSTLVLYIIFQVFFFLAMSHSCSSNKCLKFIPLCPAQWELLPLLTDPTPISLMTLLNKVGPLVQELYCSPSSWYSLS